MITNLRYKETLTKAVQSLSLAKESLLKNISFEFVVLDLRVVLDSIGEITGKVVTEDILDKISWSFVLGNRRYKASIAYGVYVEISDKTAQHLAGE